MSVITKNVLASMSVASIAAAVGMCVYFVLKKPKTMLKPVLSLDTYRKFRLVKKEVLTVGQFPVKRFRFKISGGRSLGLPVGRHISIRAILTNEEGELEEVKRAYTPTSSNDDLGFFDVVAKIYPKGKMTNHLDSLQVGKDSIEVAGPKGSYVYKKNMRSEIGMIAGGTGITPMLQIIVEILKHKDDKTKVSLLLANVTEKDIIMHDVIIKLQEKHANFRAYPVINRPPERWQYGVGYINEDTIREHLPEPSSDRSSQILLCGPPLMVKAMKGHLRSLGFKKEDVFGF